MLKIYKKAEKSKNKIVIPKKFIEKWGNEFYIVKRKKITHMTKGWIKYEKFKIKKGNEIQNNCRG